MKQRYTIKLAIFSMMTLSFNLAIGATRTAATSGNWTAPATWGGTVPVNGDNVVIPAGRTVTFNTTNFNTSHPYIDISGTLNLNPGGNYVRFMQNASFKINTGGVLRNQTEDQEMGWYMPIMTIDVGKTVTLYMSGGQVIAAGGQGIGNSFESGTFDVGLIAANSTETMSLTGRTSSSYDDPGITKNTTGIADPTNPVLPVVLASLTAKPTNNGVQLNWSTTSETNNKSFVVLKSANGTDFARIKTIAGNGTSESQKSYTFVDPMPFIGTSYYRLLQTDLDGNETILGTKDVSFRTVLTSQLKAFIKDGNISLAFPLGTTSIVIIDLNGRVIGTFKVGKDANSYSGKIPTHNKILIARSMGSYGVVYTKFACVR